MTQYIDKAAVVTEIERMFNEVKESTFESDTGTFYAIKHLRSFLDTLEAKEVDFEDYYHKFLEKEWFGKHCNRTISEMMAFTAKHFFELGLNTQQNISIYVTDIDKVIEENGVDPNSKEAKIFK